MYLRNSLLQNTLLQKGTKRDPLYHVFMKFAITESNSLCKNTKFTITNQTNQYMIDP